MVQAKRRGPAVAIRASVMIVVLGTIGFFVWKGLTRREDYRGGDLHTTGTIEAIHVQLGFQVSGRLLEVPVSEGQVVKPGQLVGRLETQDFEVQVQSARATLEAARAGLTQSRAAAAQARANQVKAARDLERSSSLMKEDATTPQQTDAARAAADVSSAQVASAEAQIEVCQAQVHQAESALAEASLRLSYAELRAPEVGVVTEKIHRPGEMVMSGTPIVALAQMDTVKVRAAVDETQVGAVRPGDRVRVHVYTFDRQVFEGTVTDIRPAGDFATRKDWGASRRDIRTFSVTATLPNRELLLKDGMTAEVTILVDPQVKRAVGATQ